MKTQLTMREGFWWSKYATFLPKPIPNEKPWKGQKAFLKRLGEVEDKLTPARYKGWSTCRICDCRNGSTEYKKGGWVWPDGLSHYIEKHNVRPSLAFQEFILGQLIEMDE